MDFLIVGNKTPPETHRVMFIKTMADLLLDKDVLVLIGSEANERIELAQTIFLKTCENTQGTNIRMVNFFKDLKGLEKEKRSIVLFTSDTFEQPEIKTKKSAAHDAFQIIQGAMKTRNNEIHALFSVSREECDDFIKIVNKSSLKYAVYDLLTMQDHKTK